MTRPHVMVAHHSITTAAFAELSILVQLLCRPKYCFPHLGESRLLSVLAHILISYTNRTLIKSSLTLTITINAKRLDDSLHPAPDSSLLVFSESFTVAPHVSGVDSEGPQDVLPHGLPSSPGAAVGSYGSAAVVQAFGISRS